MTTLAELCDSMPDSDTRVGVTVPHFRDARIMQTGGNVVALSVVIDGVPVLVALGDGVQEDDTFTVATDYPEHMSDYAEGDATTAEDVVLTAEGFVLSLVWIDHEERRRVPVYGSPEIVDAADAWDSADVICRQQCRACAEWLYRDYRSGAWRAWSTERIRCPGRNATGYVHVPQETYWQTVDSLST